MTTPKATRSAARYLREFMRNNTAKWGNLMRNASPAQGWGNSDAAHDAYEAAGFLYDETDQHFLDFTIPGDFASGADLLRGLETFRAGIEHYELRLIQHCDDAVTAGSTVPGTVGLTLRELEKCRYGVDEAVRKLTIAASAAAAVDDMDVLKKIATRFPELGRRLIKAACPLPPQKRSKLFASRQDDNASCICRSKSFRSVVVEMKHPCSSFQPALKIEPFHSKLKGSISS